MKKPQILTDALSNKVVILPEIIFKNKQNIAWDAVEKFTQMFVGKAATVVQTGDIVYMGSDFPGEYKGSDYTKHLRGANAKAKANAAQGVLEMLEIATDKHHSKNRKDKHETDAGQGWYYYTTRFALPTYKNDKKTGIYGIYSGCFLVNRTKFGKMYLYDLVDIKKEASTPLKTIE